MLTRGSKERENLMQAGTKSRSSGEREPGDEIERATGEGERLRDDDMKQVIRTLALPGKEALVPLPGAVEAPDALAIRFDEVYSEWVDAMTSLPSDTQFMAVQALDSQLNAMSDPSRRELWSNESFLVHPQWEEVRVLARRILDEFDW